MGLSSGLRKCPRGTAAHFPHGRCLEDKAGDTTALSHLDLEATRSASPHSSLEVRSKSSPTQGEGSEAPPPEGKSVKELKGIFLNSRDTHGAHFSHPLWEALQCPLRRLLARAVFSLHPHHGPDTALTEQPGSVLWKHQALTQ